MSKYGDTYVHTVHVMYIMKILSTQRIKENMHDASSGIVCFIICLFVCLFVVVVVVLLVVVVVGFSDSQY